MSAEVVALGRPAAARGSRLASPSPWFLLLLPLLVALALLFVYPIGRVVLRSFGEGAFTLENYQRIFGVNVYRVVLFNTFRISATVTLACLVLGYPVAYLMSSVGPRARNVVLALVLLSFWTSLLIRTYGWMVLFGRNGLINDFLRAIGLISEPLQLLQNALGVNIGMVHVLLPYMVLPLFSVMLGIDRRLLVAAASLGARPVAQFWRIFLPLSLPGVWAGCLLVFILALGFFITPALLGGPREFMIAVLIYQQTSQLLNWPFASALAVVLLVATLALYLFTDRLVGIEKVLGARA